MHKLLSHGIVSNLLKSRPQNPSPFLRSHPPKTSHSLAQPFICSHFSSPLPSWPPSLKLLSLKNISGFFSSSVFPKPSLHNSLLKGTTFSVGFLRAHFSRRSYVVNPSSGSYRRWRSWLPGATTDGVVLGLILANAAVFMFWRVADRNFMYKNFTISLDNVMSGRVHTMITSAFSHVQIEHIVSNMIGLYFFGMSIGRVFGPNFLLKLYFAGAIGGSLFYLTQHAFLAASSKGRHALFMDPSRIPGLGASGAVNAIMLLNIFLFPKSTLYFEFIIPVPAILLGIFLIGKDVLRIIEGDSHISGSAHLGGAAVAAIAWARIRRGRLL